LHICAYALLHCALVGEAASIYIYEGSRAAATAPL